MWLSGGSNLGACATCVFAFDATHGMALYGGIGLEARCRRAFCAGLLLLVDGAYGVGGHAGGTTRVTTAGASLLGTLAFE
jgi:hypothetical protein